MTWTTRRKKREEEKDIDDDDGNDDYYDVMVCVLVRIRIINKETLKLRGNGNKRGSQEEASKER